MKLTAILLIIGCLQLHATGFGQIITLDFKNAPLTQVLREIEKQSGYNFVYGKEQLPPAKTVSVSFSEAGLETVLSRLFKDLPLTYTIYGRYIVLKQRPSVAPVIVSDNSQPPPVEIKGTITDEKGEPVEGVTVTVKGTVFKTASKSDGSFMISVPSPDAILIFTHVSFQEQAVAIKNQRSVTVTMIASKANSLESVVVVGYGTQKRQDITGAVAVYNAKDIEDRPLARVDQALVGQMAGVQVKQTTGVPGKAFSIQVRGTGSISAGNEPLYVIDGFPLATASANGAGNFATGNPLDNINPNDIASIQVLKDAAAAAIYGSRAANGVVLITTKKGLTGQMVINFNTNVGYTERNRKLDMLSPDEWVDRATEMINAAWVASGTGRTASQTTEQRRQLLNLAPGAVNTNYMLDDRWAQPGHPGLYYIDWQDATFRKGLTQNYQLSASGGSQNVKYYVSGNYVKQQGMVIGMDYTSYSARANVEGNAGKKLKFGLNIAPSYSLTNDPGSDNFPVEGKDGLLHTLTSFTPVADNLPENVNVFNYGSYPWGTASTNYVSPVAALKNVVGLTKRFRTITSVFADYTILDGLAFRTTLNLDNTDNDINSFAPYTVRGNLTTRQTQGTVNTRGSFTGYKKQTFVNENTLSYNKVMDVHSISLLAGASYNADRLDFQRIASNGGYNSSVITSLNAASGVTGSTTATKDVLLSYFGRVQYGYDNKYLLTASIRRDGSSRFGDDTKWGLFPSASIGWRISQEKFLSHINWLSDLKLRASWGKSGNYNIGDYNSIATLGTYNYIINGVPAIGQAPNVQVNPDLRWEESRTTDLGVDVSVLDSRVSASFDYYNKVNTDLLLYVPIPASTGFTTLFNNVGKVRNSGWELEINSRNTSGAFRWTTSINISHNTNKLLALAGGQSQIIIPTLYDVPHSILRVGEPVYSIYVVKQIGILTKEDIAKHAAVYGTETEGDPKYYDYSGDGKIDADDRMIVGHPTPDYTWGITNSFKYKRFDLSFLIQGQTGGSVYSLLGRAIGSTSTGYMSNVTGEFSDRWRSESDPGNGKIGKAYSTFGNIINTNWLYPSDYFRVRDITIGYDLQKVMSRLRVNGVRLYLTAENFFGHDKYTGGYNPEAANADLSGSTQFPEPGDYGGLPLPKSLVLGLNLKF